MDDKQRNEMALFRFSLIAPSINGTGTGSIKDYLGRVCAQAHQVPGRGLQEFSPSTVKKWLLDYRRFGLEGLKRKPGNHHSNMFQFLMDRLETLYCGSVEKNNTAIAPFSYLPLSCKKQRSPLIYRKNMFWVQQEIVVLCRKYIVTQ